MMNKTKHKGLLSVEVAVAISVLVLLAGLIATLGVSFGKLNRHLWARHTCHAAAQAQMDAIAATGKPIEPDTFESLWPNVTCEIQTAEGTAPWQGLTHVQLSASTKIKKKQIRVEMSRYLPGTRQEVSR